MQEHMDPDMENVKDSKDEKLENKLKDYVDETFLLDFLVLDAYGSPKDKRSDIKKKEQEKFCYSKNN